MRIALVLGAATPPGRLARAVEFLKGALCERQAGLEVSAVDLGHPLLEICDGRPDADYGADTRAAVRTIEGARTVIFAAPVYRASFPGVLKNFLDLLPVAALRDKPVGIVAMGASAHHYLGVDWQLRQVLAWFGALALPNSVYLTSGDFAERELTSDAARSALEALGDAALEVARRLDGASLGPAPLAARWS